MRWRDAVSRDLQESDMLFEEPMVTAQIENNGDPSCWRFVGMAHGSNDDDDDYDYYYYSNGVMII